MAMSASIALNPSSAPFNKPCTAIVTVSNSGASDVTLSSLQPLVYSSGEDISAYNTGCTSQQPPRLINVTVPASGSANVTFPFVVFAPHAPGATSLTYSIGCQIISSDGSSFAPTPATLTSSTLS